MIFYFITLCQLSVTHYVTMSVTGRCYSFEYTANDLPYNSYISLK